MRRAKLCVRSVFGGCDGTVRALDARSGQVRLEVPPGSGARIPGSVAGDEVGDVAAHAGGGIVALDVATGKVPWSFEAEEGHFSTPVLAGDRVVAGGLGFVPCEDARLFARGAVR